MQHQATGAASDGVTEVAAANPNELVGDSSVGTLNEGTPGAPFPDGPPPVGEDASFEERTAQERSQLRRPAQPPTRRASRRDGVGTSWMVSSRAPSVGPGVSGQTQRNRGGSRSRGDELLTISPQTRELHALPSFGGSESRLRPEVVRHLRVHERARRPSSRSSGSARGHAIYLRKRVKSRDLCPTSAPAPVSHVVTRLRLLGDGGSGTCVPLVPHPARG